MLSIKDSVSHESNKIWIISEGRSLDVDLKGVTEGNAAGPFKEYEISDIGRYLLNPQSIEVKKKLIGGEIHYKQGVLNNIGKSFRKILPKASKGSKNGSLKSPELIVSR